MRGPSPPLSLFCARPGEPHPRAARPGRSRRARRRKRSDYVRWQRPAAMQLWQLDILYGPAITSVGLSQATPRQARAIQRVPRRCGRARFQADAIARRSNGEDARVSSQRERVERRRQGSRNQAEAIGDHRDQRGGVRLVALGSRAADRLHVGRRQAHDRALTPALPLLHLYSHRHGSRCFKGGSLPFAAAARRASRRLALSATAGVDRRARWRAPPAGSVSRGTSAAPLGRDHRGRGRHRRRGGRGAAASRGRSRTSGRWVGRGQAAR